MAMQIVETCGAGLLMLAFVVLVLDYMSKTMVQAGKITQLENKVAALTERLAVLENSTLPKEQDEINGKHY